MEGKSSAKSLNEQHWVCPLFIAVYLPVYLVMICSIVRGGRPNACIGVLDGIDLGNHGVDRLDTAGDNCNRLLNLNSRQSMRDIVYVRKVNSM